MNPFIIETAAFAAHVLKHNPLGSVHSVYRKTINLNMGTHLVALQAAESPLSPISLITNLNQAEMQRLPVHSGDPVTTDGHHLKIFSNNIPVIFDLKRMSVFDSFLTDKPVILPLSDIKEALLLAQSGGLSELFTEKKQKASSDFGKEAFLAVAKKRLEDTRTLLHKTLYEEACDPLVGMLGLGIGLTPSGDDFLCGVLAGLLFSGHWEHPFARTLRMKLSRHLGDTNDISRAFLSCSLQRHFSRPVKELPLSEDPHHILSLFGQIGHSSGIDTLCGIYFIFCCFSASA